MDTIKTFLNNATKAPGEERESYGISGSSDDVKDSTSAQSSAAATTQKSSSTSGSNVITENYAAEKKEMLSKKDNAAESVKQSGSSAKAESTDEVTYDKEVTPLAPKVHERVHRTIVDENQKEIDRDHHVDHYAQKIQPIAVSQVKETEHAAGTDITKEKEIDNHHGARSKEAIAKQDAAVQNTAEEDVQHESVNKEDIVHEKTHHHIHERVQPVLEKDVYEKEVRHNKETVKETIHDEDVIDQSEVLPTKYVKEEDIAALKK